MWGLEAGKEFDLFGMWSAIGRCLEIGEVNGGQMRPGLTGCREDFGFYTLCSKRLFEGFNEQICMISPYTFKTLAIACTMGWYNRAAAKAGR